MVPAARGKLLEPFAPTGRAHVLEVLEALLEARDARRPFSLVRLGDGEGRLLGFPELADKAELDRSLTVWFGRTDFDAAALGALAGELRAAVRAADIVGVPRLKQQERRAEYRLVVAALRHHALIGPAQRVTDSTIHRYLQFGLFYRRLLAGEEFCGVVAGRDLAPPIRAAFGVGRVEVELVPAETRFPGARAGNHFPDRFEELRHGLKVPFRGALYLVGAGALGKIYCHWIKQAGGIALDIGAISDSWAGRGRLQGPMHRIERYLETPSLSLHDALARYNQCCDNAALDAERLSPGGYAESHTRFF